MINNNNNINNNTYNKVILTKLIYFDGYNAFNLDILKNIKEMFIYLQFFLLKNINNFIYKFIFFLYLITTIKFNLFPIILF